MVRRALPTLHRSTVRYAFDAAWNACSNGHTTSYDLDQGKFGAKPTLTRNRERYPSRAGIPADVDQPTVVVCGVAHTHGRDSDALRILFCLSSISLTRLYEWKRVYNTIIRRTGLALGVALLASSLATSPASATPGLFGSQDATYDGVYRQSLVIAGLRANKVAVPKAAIAWLNGQQCPDGGFEAFRADTAVACAPGNADLYAGEDTNATASAAIAFAAVKDVKRAKRALGFLRATQNADGGFPYYKGGLSDVNSTAMVLMAFTANGIKPASLHRGDLTPIDFLITATVGCEGDAGIRGGMAYMPSVDKTVSVMATAQALASLAGATPWMTPVKASKRAAVVPTLQCPGTLSDELPKLRDYVAGYSARVLAANNNVFVNPWGPGNDLTSTAWAVIGLAAADRAGAQASLSDKALRSNAASYVADSSGNTNAGRTGLLLLLVAARHESAKSFGGVNLVTSALGSLSNT